ncbi:MAG: DUF3536 domain-containing protein, partial [Gemmatimonadetes bacterium]|nr:DUF3536 domain-containing protein [Gemmatimonadota bacterium]
AYHHPILPLATRRDKRTEIRWGIQDFKRRFGRHPEGMWLPETAADLETLEVLAGEGVQFTILAPHQVRGKPPRGRPGRIRTATGESLTVVPYRGDLSHAVAFGDALRDAEGWAELLVQVGGGGDLCLLSTDGETYGHHKKFGEMALAATLEKLDASVEVELTNLAAYLAEHPATEEVELVSPSSWSCAHGVGRWKEDCGCRLDLRADTSQAWRKPLRRAVSALAEELHTVFESKAEGIFEDPWEARDAYGEVVGVDEPSQRRAWVEKRYPGSESEVDRAVQLLELERNALRIFTSCAWFFDDLAGVEQVQVLRYAARALELAESLGGSAEELRAVLLDALSTARSNESEPRNGRRFYLEDVVPSVPATAYVAARRVAGLSAPPGPWAAQVDGDRSRVTVTHAATGEAVRFEVENPSDHETPASPGSPAGVELIDPDGRKFTVDPEAPWP